MFDGFFLDEPDGALDFFIWAAIGLKYHPASRLRGWASKRMRGKFMLRAAGFYGA